MAIVTPCDSGFVVPDLGVLVESFNRLTAPPSRWPHIGMWLMLAFASVSILDRRELLGGHEMRDRVVHRVARSDPSELEFMIFCPGCNCGHGWKVDGPGPIWSFNGDFDKPTISPSLLVRWGNANGPQVCHSFISNGQIQFLADCTHALAGQTVQLEPF